MSSIVHSKQLTEEEDLIDHCQYHKVQLQLISFYNL
jgi:hypothetical protein